MALASHVPVLLIMRGFSFDSTYQKESLSPWCCWVINKLEPTDNLSSSIRLAVRQCTESGHNAFCIPTYLLFIDINWDTLLSFHDNCRPSVPSNKISNPLMDLQQSDMHNRANVTTCLVLAKAAQKLTENPFDLTKAERGRCLGPNGSGCKLW